MFSKRTYIFLLPFIACLVFSCSSDVPDNVVPEKGPELTFAVSDLTRASVTTEINSPGSKFVVYGEKKFIKGNADEESSIIFDKTEVEYVDGNWSYDNVQYWFPKHTYSFVALSPLSIVSPENNPLYSGSEFSFTYAVPVSAENEIVRNGVQDFLGATHRRYYELGDGLPVSLKFGHLMSLVNIAPAMSNNAMSSEANIQFKKIVVTGLKNKVTFKIRPASILSNNQTDDRVIEVTEQEGESKMTIEFAEPVKIMNKAGNVPLFDANDALLMLPQSFDEDSEATIIMTYTMNDDPEIWELSLPLKLLKWESGKSYTYNFTFDGKRVSVGTPSISDWNTVEEKFKADSD